MLLPLLMSAATDPGRPSKEGDPPPEWAMRTYVLGLIYRGPNPVTDPKESDALFRAHLANNRRLADEGKLLLAGPFLDKTDLRGVWLFDVTTVEEAQVLCDSDPAIQAGTLRVELHPWYSAKGIGVRDEPARRAAR
ncbi:MAG: YciI family protein [Candidatus Eiseniibacteriota bacterium]